MTAKHHEGWTNWCSPEAFNWNSCEAEPGRDLVGDLTAAVRKAGLRMGLYHSIFEFFHPLWLADKANNLTTARYVDEVYFPQAQDLINKYAPDLVWSDGDWEANSSYWRSPELLAWMYNTAPNRDSVVVNDRWGSDNPPIGSGKRFGGYFSGGDRQQAATKMLGHKWENAFTLDADTHNAWSYVRPDPLSTYMNASTMLYELVSTVAYGGNVLINVGPTADGRIPTIFQERLKQLGGWLQTNGEVIYAAKMWRAQNDTAEHGPGHGVFYTANAPAAAAKGGGGGGPAAVYALVLAWPSDNVLRLAVPQPTPSAAANLLGCPKSLGPVRKAAGGGMVVTIPALSPAELPSSGGLVGPWVFKLTGVL